MKKISIMNETNELDGEKFSREHCIFADYVGGAIYRHSFIEKIVFFTKTFTFFGVML